METTPAELSRDDYNRLVALAETEGKSVEEYAGELLSDILEGEEDDEVFRLKDGIADELRNDPSRIVAEYYAQEWRGPDNDYARETHKEYWDVTALIEEMDIEEVRKIMDNNYTSDHLVRGYTSHDGPHDVHVTDQIQQYWKHTRGEPLWE